MNIEELNKQARPLTKGEIRGLKKKGLSISTLTPENTDDVIDEVLEIVYGNIEIFDNLPNPEVTTLFRQIMKLTYGGGTDEKN
jgi:hypothetical protein